MTKRYFLSMSTVFFLVAFFDTVYFFLHKSVETHLLILSMHFILYGVLLLLFSAIIYKPIYKGFVTNSFLEKGIARISTITWYSTLLVFLTGIFYAGVICIYLFIAGIPVDEFTPDNATPLFIIHFFPSLIFVYALFPAFIVFFLINDYSIDLKMEVHKRFQVRFKPGKRKIGMTLLFAFLITGFIPTLLGILDVFSINRPEYSHITSISPMGALLSDKYIVLLGLVISIIFLTRSFTKPIGSLLAEIDNVRKGDFTRRAVVGTSDEIGILTQSFNEMVLGLNERDTQLSEQNKQLRIFNEEMEQLVEQRTTKLNETLRDLAETNKKVSDSINYAKIIQTSLLPDTQILKEHLKDSFIIWKPRDVVSGDLYFAEKVAGGIIIAVIDCTGHGIPGAFMTMIANSGLRKIITEEKCSDPALILQLLNHYVKTSLHQEREETESDNGLEGALCFVDQASRKVSFAGAKSSVIVVKDGAIKQYKGDRYSIGYKKSNLDFEFTNHLIGDIRENLSIYLHSDGYVDQAGGTKGFPFGNKRFLELIDHVSSHPFSIQNSLLEEAFDAYRGSNTVRDDFTIVGFRP